MTFLIKEYNCYTMSFRPIFESHPWDAVKASIYAKTSADVERALAAPRRTLDDFKALISPAAAPYLEQMALWQYHAAVCAAVP
jgi:hypothetical protein